MHLKINAHHRLKVVTFTEHEEPVAVFGELEPLRLQSTRQAEDGSDGGDPV